MPSWVQDGPFAVVYLFLLLVVFCRAQGTYWLGRAAAAGALHSRWSESFTGPQMTRAIASIDRWGLPVIPLSFLTIGFQTAVNAGAGLIRIRWVRYTAAMVPGCLAWALIYTAGGLAAFQGAMALLAASPWALVAAILLAVALVALVVLWRRRRREQRQTVEALTAQD